MAYPSDLVRTKNWGTEILTDADLEGQYDLIINWVMASLNASAGHTHSGSGNNGPKLSDGSLNTITTAGKVSGAALTLLGSVPAGSTALPVTSGGTGSTAAANGASGVVVLDASSKLPAVDGSQLTGFVVGQIPAILGSWVDKTSSYAAQQATTDGFVCVCAHGGSSTERMTGYTDGNADPTTIRGQCTASFAGAYTSFMMPVRKNDYWKCVKTGSITVDSVYFISLGS